MNIKCLKVKINKIDKGIEFKIKVNIGSLSFLGLINKEIFLM